MNARGGEANLALLAEVAAIYRAAQQ